MNYDYVSKLFNIGKKKKKKKPIPTAKLRRVSSEAVNEIRCIINKHKTLKRKELINLSDIGRSTIDSAVEKLSELGIVTIDKVSINGHRQTVITKID